MKHKLLFLILALALVFPPNASLAQRPSGEPGPFESGPRLPKSSALRGEKDPFGAREKTLKAAGPVHVVVELEDEPAVETLVAAQPQSRDLNAQVTSATKAQLARINQAQDVLSASLSAMGAQEIYRVQRVYNGIAVIVDPDQLARIEKLPGVKAVHQIVPKQIDNSNSMPLIGAPQLWQKVSQAGLNVTGKGIKIGIIDTGVDYLHADLGGPGIPFTSTPPVSRTFPTAKVVGGYDFAGDSYDPVRGDSIPQPDPDPMDCYGHGTHVAGIAAGYGVLADGTTYRGPYSATLDFTQFEIGPGAAPEASLYALRVFGCYGSTDLVDAAIEWAVDPNGDGDFSDHLDVINMSLGSDYGVADDTTTVASDRAALAGVIVVAAAGNSGDTDYISSSPATSDRAMSVASSVNTTRILSGIRVNAPASIAGVYSAARSSWWRNEPDYGDPLPITGTLVYPVTNTTGCAPFPISDVPAIFGKIVLLDWRIPGKFVECATEQRTQNAAEAGARGVILVYDVPFLDDPDFGGAYYEGIPTLVTTLKNGQLLKSHLGGAGGVNVTLNDPRYFTNILEADPELTNILSDFSSRGPRRGDSALKPDIAAPGQYICSALIGSGHQGLCWAGTSMATPHVAGSMALLRQLNPGWTVEELKALAMNTALHDLRPNLPITSTLISPVHAGAGRIDLAKSAQAEAVAYNADAPGLVSVSFGNVEAIGVITETRHIRVVNKTGRTVAYTAAYSDAVSAPGVDYGLSASSISLPPGGDGIITVTLTANADQMKHADPAEPLRYPRPSWAQSDFWRTEKAGYVMLTPTDGSSSLRVPVYAAPRPASDMRAGQAVLNWGATPAISLTGQGVDTSGGGAAPLLQDEYSLVTALELQESSPRIPGLGQAGNADIKYLGVTSDYEATHNVLSTTIFLGVATWSNWSTPNEIFFRISIDTDGNGERDYYLYNLVSQYGGAYFHSMLAPVWCTRAVCEIGEGPLNGIDPGERDTVLFNTNVMVFPVRASDLGFTNTARFTYWVETYSFDAAGRVKVGAKHTFDAANPGLDFTGGARGVPMWPDRPGSAIPVTGNLPSYLASGGQGILLLHHHNATGQHDQVIDVWLPHRVYLPMVAKQ